MLATLTGEPFNDKNWLFEIKWDGYRALAYLQGKKVELLSRKNISFNKKYRPVQEALEQWNIRAVVDGEIVALNEEGISSFQQLQQWQKTGQGELVYYLFDLLWIEGYNIMDIPLTDRKAILAALIPGNDVIRYSDHITENGKDFFKAATEKKLEGILAKKADSSYAPGIRTREWLKIKTQQRQEVVIGGFTKARGSRKHFGALVLGVYENGKLVYAGHTGTGFDDKTLAMLDKKLRPLITDKSPFAQKPKTNMPCTWVKPKLVCEIRFSEWTESNRMRQPVFLGLREDKNPKEVKREKPVHAK